MNFDEVNTGFVFFQLKKIVMLDFITYNKTCAGEKSHLNVGLSWDIRKMSS